VRRQTQGVLLFGKQLRRHAIAIDQILVEIVFHVLIRNLLLQRLVDWILAQRAGSKDRKVHIRKLVAKKVLDLFVCVKLLVKIVRWKGQDRKALITVLFLQLCQFRKIYFRLASFASCIDHKCYHPSVL